MATVIKLKRGTSTPTVSDIVSGEVAIDTSAQKFYVNDSGTVKEIGGAGAGSLGDLSNVTETSLANGNYLAYNGSNWRNEFDFNIGKHVPFTESDGTQTSIPLTNNRDVTTPTGLLNNIVSQSYYFPFTTSDGTDVETIELGRITNSDLENSSITVSGDSGSDGVSLGETLTISGGTGIDTTGTSNTITIATSQDIATTSSPTFVDLTLTGNLTVQGTTTTIDSTTIQITNSFTFEGSTADAFETVLGVIDPTADRTINLPNASGTIVLQDTTDTLTNKTINASNNTLSNIANSSLSNSSITVAGDSGSDGVSLGETLTVSGDTGITTTVTSNTISVDLDDTAVTPGEYGSSTETVTVTVDQQGRITSISEQIIPGTSFAAIGESIVPDANETYDLGTASLRWRDIYLSGNTIDLNGATISADGTGTIQISASGATLPEGSKVGTKTLATAGDDGVVEKDVSLFTAAGGLLTAAATFTFKGDIERKFTGFTFANGSSIGNPVQIFTF